MNPDVHTLTGAYALNALDAHERADFEHHLADCPECSREVEELRLTANRLGAAVAEPPPDALRQRVLAQISRTRQDPPAGPRLVTSRGQQRFPRRWTIAVTSAAAVIALALAGTFGITALHERQQLNAARQQLATAAAEYGPVARVLAAPDAQSVTVSGKVGGTATVLMSRALNKGVLLAFNMPTPPKDRIYEAWAIGSAGDKSLGLMAGGSSGPVLMDTLGGATSVGVTVEPAGGSAQPTTTPVMLVSLPV